METKNIEACIRTLDKMWCGYGTMTESARAELAALVRGITAEQRSADSLRHRAESAEAALASMTEAAGQERRLRLQDEADRDRLQRELEAMRPVVDALKIISVSHCAEIGESCHCRACMVFSRYEKQQSGKAVG